MLNILIIDDEKPARDRLRRLVDAIPDYRVAGEAANGSEALERIRELSPDILLLDISMPGIPRCQGNLRVRWSAGEGGSDAQHRSNCKRRGRVPQFVLRQLDLWPIASHDIDGQT